MRPKEKLLAGDVSKRYGELMEELDGYGLGEAYRSAITLARSARQLEWLHNRFEPDERLMREDFVTVREHWRSLWGDKQPRGELPDDAVGLILGLVRKDA